MAKKVNEEGVSTSEAVTGVQGGAFQPDTRVIQPVNNIQNDMQFPKKMRLNVYSPVVAFCMFLITLAILLIAAVIGYAGYYVYENGFDFLDGVKKTDYDKMVDRYEDTIAQYESTLADYDEELTKYRDELAAVAEDMDTMHSDAETSIATLQDELLKLEDMLMAVSDNSASANTGDDPFYVYYYGEEEDYVSELKNIYEDDNIVWVPYSDDYLYDYTSEDVMALLEDEDSEMYPDMILGQNSVLADIDDDMLLTNEDLDIDDTDFDDMYTLGKDAGTNEDGDINRFTYYVSPGYIQIRADLAEKYFDTTDPDVIYEEYFCDMETMADTCNYIYDESNGKVSLFAGYDDVQTMYWGASKEPEMTLNEFMELTDGSLYEAIMWSDEWFDYLEGANRKKSVMASVASPWFTEYILADSKFADGNSILVRAPFDYTYGCESAVVPSGSSNTELAAELIDTVVNDTTFGEELLACGYLFPNNVNVDFEDCISESMEDYIYDQDYVFFFREIMK